MSKRKKLHHVGRRTLSFLKSLMIVLLSLALFALQVYLLYKVLFTAHNIRWLYVLVNFLGIVCVISLVGKDMVSSFKIIWIIIILVFPFVGTIFYLFCGDEKTFPKRKSAKIKKYLDSYIPHCNNLDDMKTEDPILYKHLSLLVRGCDYPYYHNTDMIFYNDIDKKASQMIDDIKNAKKYVLIEYFIISSGKMFEELFTVLEEVGKRGIEIKIIYDDFGSGMNFKTVDQKRLKQIPNLQMVKFAPLGVTINLTVNYRDHRKIVVVDGKVGYVGGDNIADEYANYISRFGFWRDNAIRLEGEAVTSLLYMFLETWYLSTKQMLNINNYQVFYQVENKSIVMPYADGPSDKRNPALDLYTSLANNARDYLYISTPYLIINQDFINELCMCAKSGVDVRILVPGIPDKKTVYLLTNAHFGELLKAGVKIYKFTPGFNHAKNFICDDCYATVGTVNVDYRSLYLHFENGVLINDEKIVKEMKNDFLVNLEQSEEITYISWKKRPWFNKCIEFILKLFSTLM